jgi:protein-disulfide isomerase
MQRENLEDLTKNYVDKGLLKIAFYEFPLIQNKQVARHHGVICAGEQGLYRDFMTSMYARKDFRVEDQEALAASIKKLKLKKWKSCMKQSQRLSTQISKHIKLGRAIGVNGTSSIFVNGVAVANFKDEITKTIGEGSTQKASKRL